MDEANADVLKNYVIIFYAVVGQQDSRALYQQSYNCRAIISKRFQNVREGKVLVEDHDDSAQGDKDADLDLLVV